MIGRKLVVALVACVLLVLSLASVAIAYHPYATYANNVSLAPGAGRGSAYDTTCNWWNENYMAKSVSGRNGTLAWINTGGGWVASVKTTEQVMNYGISNHQWTKKLHCVNSSTVTYNATCRGHGNLAGPGCV